MPIKIKICGLTTEDAVAAAKESGADYFGFVFYPPSPRNVSVARAVELAKNLPKKQTATVLVNPDDALLSELANQFKPGYFQLHGNESPARVAEIKKKFDIPVIKAIRVKSSDDIASASGYFDVADMLMFDALVPDGLPGGNGLAFDWIMLQNRDFPLPWFLSGGLNADNVARAVAMSGARMVDVSSSLESAPGVKDPGLVRAFIKQVKALTP